jgi:predicted ribosomally synthesized peptide with SipW-like signal peptide
MERKNTVLLTVIAVATLLVAVIGATFAYFTATVSGTAQNTVQVTTSSIDTVNTTAAALALNVTLQDMLKGDGNSDFSVSKSSTAQLTITASTGTGGGTNTCTYDLFYEPHADNHNDVGGYTTPFTYATGNTGSLKELTLTGAAVKGGAGVASTTTFAEKDLANISAKTKLVTGATFAITGVSASDTLTWTITAKYYNLGVDQTSNAGKTFGGNFGFENVSCVNS